LACTSSNQQASGTGNDVALDEISILDVSPQLSQAFGDPEIPLWTGTIMTFIVTNTSELGANSGFAFTENLPAGLQVGPYELHETTCRNASSTGAKPQSKVLTFNGKPGQGQESCASRSW
jgi:hypothetical protein